MMHLNLLPWRAEKREAIKKQFLTQLVGTLLITLLIIGALHWSLAKVRDQQQQRNDYLTTQEQRYHSQMLRIGQLQKTRKSLEARMTILSQVQQARSLTANLFNAFTAIIPDGVYLSEIERDGAEIQFKGTADSNSQVSQLMRHVDTSPWLNSAKLKVIKASEKHRYQREFDLRAMEQRAPQPTSSK